MTCFLDAAAPAHGAHIEHAKGLRLKTRRNKFPSGTLNAAFCFAPEHFSVRYTFPAAANQQ